MAYKQQVAALLSTKMDRKDFLKSIAIGMVALSGASAALKMLSAPKPQNQQATANSGYGGSAYGGSTDGQ